MTSSYSASTVSASSVTTNGVGHSSAVAEMTGQQGVLVAGDARVEVSGGRVSLNGMPYGRVGPNAVVRLVVTDGEVQLLVDGVERHPER